MWPFKKKPIKLCKDCKWFRMYNALEGFDYFPQWHSCEHIKCSEVDSYSYDLSLITGRMENITNIKNAECRKARKFLGKCGKLGKYWEKKDV